MTPFVVRFFPPEDVRLFEEAVRLFRKLPDIDLGFDDQHQPVLPSCHMLARAMAPLLGLPWVDGRFGEMNAHSWLVTPNEHVLDVYPVAMLGGPILVYGKGTCAPAKRLYHPQSTRVVSGGVFGSSWFRRAVRQIAGALRE